MSNLENIPLIDWFETTLAQAWDWLVGTMYVNDIPSFTFPSGVTTYVVVNPGKSTMQVAEINAKSSGQLTVSNVAIEKGAGVNYTSILHSAGSKVIISDNYEFWKDIRTAVNSKLDQDGGNGVTYTNEAARDAALWGNWVATKEYRMIKVTSTGLFYNYNLSTSQWESVDTGVATPFGDETTAGKWQGATTAQMGTATETGSTGAKLVVINKNLVKTPTGTWDENKIPVLDASGKIATGFLPSGASSTSALYTERVLWETLSLWDVVSIWLDNKVYKYLWDGSSVSDGLNITWWSKQIQSLSSTSFVTLAWNNAWLIQTIIGTTSWNVVSYGSSNSFTPTSWSSFRGTPSLVVLSPTLFVVVYWYSWFSGGNTEFLQATAYSVSGTTITRWATNTITNNTTQQVVSWVCKVDSNKFMISYVATTNTIVAGTVSGTTITAGTAVNSLAISWIPIYVATDKVAITEWTNIRLYTFSWTAPTQWNNLSIGTTYTSYAIRDIGNSKSIFTGTVSTNTQAFIVDNSWSTPIKWTTITVLAASTSTDCIKAWDISVCIVTWWNKYYFYSYSGTTLSFLNNLTKTDSTSVLQNDYLWNMKFIVPWRFISNLKIAAYWVMKESGVLDETKKVGINWCSVPWLSWLLLSVPLYVTSAWVIATSWDFIIWRANSSTEIHVDIPYNTL